MFDFFASGFIQLLFRSVSASCVFPADAKRLNHEWTRIEEEENQDHTDITDRIFGIIILFRLSLQTSVSIRGIRDSVCDLSQFLLFGVCLRQNSFQRIFNSLKSEQTSQVLDRSAPTQGTSLTASCEGQIRGVWGKALIQTRAITRQWDCTVHHACHGEGEWFNGLCGREKRCTYF